MKLALFPVHTRGTLKLVFILAYFGSDIFDSQPGIEDKQGPVPSKLGFSAIDIELDNSLRVRVCPMHPRMFSRAPGFYPLDAGSMTQPEMSPDIAKWEKNCTQLRTTALNIGQL